jgi:hypothetical protein
VFKHFFAASLLYLLVLSSSALAANGSVLYTYWRDDHTPSATTDGVWRCDFATGSKIQIYGKNDGANVKSTSPYAVFSPDGSRIAFFRSGRLYICNNDGSDLKEVASSLRQPNRDNPFSWNTGGIFWHQDGIIYRCVPSTGNVTNFAIKSGHDGGMHQRYFASFDGRKVWMRDPSTVVDFNADFSSFTKKAWGDDHGHGDGMTMDGELVLHIKWDCGIWCHKVMRARSRATFAVMDTLAPPVADGTALTQRVANCFNNNDWLAFQVHDDSHNDIYQGDNHYSVWNWKTDDYQIVPHPDGDPEGQANICGFWLGALPQAGEHIALDKNELVFTLSGGTAPAAQNINLTYSGNGTLGTVTTTVTPSSATWLTVSVNSGANANARVISNSIVPANVSGDVAEATVEVSAGTNINSVSYKVVINSAGVLPAPTNLKADAVGDSLRDVLLQWNDNSDDETGFSIERKKGTSGSWAEIGTASANDTSYLDTNLALGTYSYRVRAAKDQTYSNYSNEQEIELLGLPWIRVTAPVAGAVLCAGSDYVIKWTSHRVTQVTVQISTNSGITWDVISKEGGITNTMAEWQNFTWKVPDIDNSEVIVKVQEYQETLEGVSGVFSVTHDSSAFVEHKPHVMNLNGLQIAQANGRLRIAAAGQRLLSAKLYAPSGRCMKAAQSTGRQVCIPIAGLTSGVYVLRANHGMRAHSWIVHVR